MPRRRIGVEDVGRAVRLNIKQLREAQHFTTRSLADKLAELGRPVGATGITKIEQGQRRVDVDDLCAFARAFGVQPERLLAALDCPKCHGAPPSGFICGTCGAGGADGKDGATQAVDVSAETVTSEPNAALYGLCSLRHPLALRVITTRENSVHADTVCPKCEADGTIGLIALGGTDA